MTATINKKKGQRGKKRACGRWAKWVSKSKLEC